MTISNLRRVTRDGSWIPEIDGLRFIAIFSVLLFHMAGELANRSGHLIAVEPRYHFLLWMIGNGDRGVRLFFVISGMILAMPYARQYLAGGKKVSLRKYYLRRVTRLEPPYLLAMLLFTVMVATYTRGHLEPHYARHAVASALYLHTVAYGTASIINPVTWSLEVEIQFYVVAPLIMKLFRIPGKLARRTVMLVGILALGLVQSAWHPGVIYRVGILFYLQYFLAGLLLADIFVLDLAKMRTSWLWDLAAIFSLAVMLGPDHNLFAAHVVLPFTFALLCLAAMRSVLFRRLVSTSWVAVLGGMCYSIYLLHFALIAVFFKLTRHAISPKVDFLGNYLIQWVLMGVPVLLLCTLFYVLVERPCMDPQWPSKLWHRVTGHSGTEVDGLDASGIAE